MSSYYRDRDYSRDYTYSSRDYETESVSGQSTRDGRKVVVKRYKVPDNEEDVNVRITRDDRRGGGDRYYDDRDYRYERGSRDIDVDVREYRDRGHREPEYREYRIERDIDREPPRRDRDDFELESYSRTREIYRDDRPVQPIVIRQEAQRPIIIREREPAQQQIVIREKDRTEEVDRRTEVSNSRALTRREPSPEQDEDYYYEKRTRRIQRRDESTDDKRSDHRSVHPKDSASQQGSDGSDYYYEKRTTEEWEGPGRDPSPNHKRHLAEGAIAGLGAAALLQNHRKKEGKDPGGVGRLVGGAALGGLAAEGITRARSRLRSRSRPRGDDDRSPRDRARDGGRDGGRDDSNEREGGDGNGPHIGTWGKVGAVAALGALAGYAASRRGKGPITAVRDRVRSRSRGRGRSVSRGRSDSEGERAKDPDHRKKIVAGAGLASAAVAGLVERARSKSKGGRSQSLGRKAIPVAAAGLGGAAIAGLWENHKKSKREREENVEGARGRSRSRSRSVSRSRSGYDDGAPIDAQYGTSSAPPGNPPLLEYSYGANTMGPGQYGRPRSSESYEAAPAHYRRRSASSDGSAEGAAAAGAGGAGYAAMEADRRRERRRQQRARRQEEEAREDTPAGGGYESYGPYGQPPPHDAQPPFYSHTNEFPPPPTNAYSPAPNYPGGGYEPPYGTGAAQHPYPGGGYPPQGNQAP